MRAKEFRAASPLTIYDADPIEPLFFRLASNEIVTHQAPFTFFIREVSDVSSHTD